MNKEYATFLLSKNREDYNRIADQFDLTRSYISKDFEYLKQFIDKNDRILDLGCGNGRFSELVADDKYIGIDISEKELEITKKKYPQKEFSLMKDSLSIPFEKESFDSVFCLAVLHHIPSKEFRNQYIKEIKRVLKKEGKLILTVWNLKKDRKTIKLISKYFFLKILEKTKLDFKDVFYPWKDSKGNIIIQRYVHRFSLKELKKIFENQGFKIIELKELIRSNKGSNLLIVCQKHS